MCHCHCVTATVPAAHPVEEMKSVDQRLTKVRVIGRLKARRRVFSFSRSFFFFGGGGGVFFNNYC